jgi:hypothetical protein
MNNASVGLKINNGQGGTAELTIANADSQHVMSVISGVFQVLGSPLDETKVRKVPEEEKINEVVSSRSVQPTEALHRQTESSIKSVDKESILSRPRQLPYVNGDRTLTQNLGEKLQEVIGQPQSQDDQGIRVYDGISHYQTAYECPACQHTGRRFMRESNDYCKCHNCDTKLRLRFATTQGFPERDEEGNYFRADALFE